MAVASLRDPGTVIRLLDRIDGLEARVRFRSFTKRMVTGYDQAPHIVEHLVPALEWAVATPNARLIVTMPPRHSKSLHVSENLPAWFLGNHPDRRIISASHTAALAYTFSRRVRNKMIDPRWPFPDVHVADDKGAVQAWDIADNTGGYIAVGVGGSPTGHGGNLVIDDPLRSASDADSQVVRDGLWEWYRETMRTRLEPEGFIILTATRWHEDDLTGRLLNEMANGGEQWRHLHLPAIDETEDALWPDRWSLDALESIRSAVGSRAWEAQYQGRPTPATGGVFKRHWWKFWQYRGQSLPPVMVKDDNGNPRECPVVDMPPWWDTQAQSWDMTFKETQSGSYVVGLVGAVYGANVFLLDRFRERTDFPGSISAVARMSNDWPQATAKLIEDKANGPAVIATLKNHVSGIIAVQTDGGKEARANAITPFVEAGNEYLPHPANAPWVQEFIDEHASFPNGANDDQVDANSQLVRYLLGGGRGLVQVSGDVANYLNSQFVS